MLYVYGEPPPGHLQATLALLPGALKEAANAGAATETAAIGTLHAAPRATVRRETYEDMMKFSET